MDEIMTRRAAAERGLKQYRTGRPCGRGHLCMRWTSTGACVECQAAHNATYGATMRRTSEAVRRGYFAYPCRVEDFDKVEAYCRALDLARGMEPQSRLVLDAAPERRWMTPEEVDAALVRVHGPEIAARMKAQREQGG